MTTIYFRWNVDESLWEFSTDGTTYTLCSQEFDEQSVGNWTVSTDSTETEGPVVNASVDTLCFIANPCQFKLTNTVPNDPNSNITVQIINNGVEIDFVRDYINAFPEDSDGLWTYTAGNTDPWVKQVICIHEDMIVDMTGLPISKCDNIDIANFSRRLNLGSSREFICISQGALGNGLPTADLLLTRGHPIVFDGREIECQLLVNNDDIYIKHFDSAVRIYAYEFKNNDRKPIKMHGVDVVQWGDEDFRNFMTRTIFIKN